MEFRHSYWLYKRISALVSTLVEMNACADDLWTLGLCTTLSFFNLQRTKRQHFQLSAYWYHMAMMIPPRAYSPHFSMKSKDHLARQHIDKECRVQHTSDYL
jgi:hypothetical protein